MSERPRIRIPRVKELETRPREIHRHPCVRCPSAHGPPDPLSLDYMSAPRDVQLREGIFPCGWRPNKMCKGVCDKLNVKEEDIKDNEEECDVRKE
jgi:hypothetical protein